MLDIATHIGYSKLQSIRRQESEVTIIMIDEKDKKVISIIQGDIPLDPRPFRVAARKVGMTEKELIETIRRLKQEGVIRRFGATLRHQEAGFSSNAMVAWKVPDERIDEVGNKMAEFREVTHCYHRKPQPQWPYNLYTMIHGSSKEQCHQIAKRISEATGVTDYILLFSEKEFKKTSMEYF